ncbi:MAG: hypothetical protein MI919_36555 [Holophagales bacterium]|nr:hypothetical protein [Holophagales bacterium]
MNGTLPRVRPGDVISADLFNDLIRRIEILESQVGQGGSGPPGGAVAIEGFTPVAEVAALQNLAIRGRNFAIPVSRNTVRVMRPGTSSGGVVVTELLPRSTSTVLRLRVPDLGPIAANGESFVVRVDAAEHGTTEELFRFLPPRDVQGEPPTITGVVDAETGRSPMRVGRIARIVGTNFAAAPADNQVQILVSTSTGGTRVYPEVGGSLQVASSSTSTLLDFTVPPIDEASPTRQLTVVVRVTVGDHAPAERNGRVLGAV